ncbi:mechanosensitive ion channel domain-containing protein [Bacteroidota bacterium]
MEIAEFQLSNVFIRFIIWGTILFLLFRLIKYIYPFFISKKKRRQNINIVLLVSETITWLIFFTSFVLLYGSANNAFVLIILAVLLILIYWISRYWVKDIIAGVVFRVSARYETGDVLQLGEHKGIIRSFLNYTIEIESKDGKIIYLPYSKILEQPHQKFESTEKMSGYTFSLVCETHAESSEIIGKIKNSILTLPWVSDTRNPVIILQSQTEDKLQFEITVYPIDITQQGKIEKVLKDKYEKLIP